MFLGETLVPLRSIRSVSVYFAAFVFQGSSLLVRQSVLIIVILRQHSCWAAALEFGHNTLSCASGELPAQAPSGLSMAHGECDYISVSHKTESEDCLDICYCPMYSAHILVSDISAVKIVCIFLLINFLLVSYSFLVLFLLLRE